MDLILTYFIYLSCNHFPLAYSVYYWGLIFVNTIDNHDLISI